MSPERAAPGYVFSPAPLRLGLFDLGGVLHHANYLGLLEEAREDFLRQRALSSAAMARAKRYLAVANATQDFLKPIFYGEDLRVVLWVSQLKQSSLTMQHEISSGGGELLFRASVRLVYVETCHGRLQPARLPEILRAAFHEILR